MKGKKRFLVWPALLLCWLPCYISYFPGIYSYDIPFQHLQILGLAPWNNHQPVIHTLFWGLCWKAELLTGYHPAALIVYSVLQMLLQSFLLSLVVLRLGRFGRFAPLAGFLWYALMPALAVFAPVTAKDVVFAGLFVFWLTMLPDLYEKKTVTLKTVLPLIITGLFICLLRKNAPYVLLMTALVFLLLKKTWLSIGVFIPAILSFFITGFVYGWVGVEPSSEAEMLSVPMSQLASVYNDEDALITKKDRSGIEYYMSPEAYNPRIADPLKDTFRTDMYKKNKAAFWKLYFHVFSEEPVRMLRAGLMLNEPYWNPFVPFPDPYAHIRYIETYISVETRYRVECAGVLPHVHDLYDSFARHDNRLTNSRFTGWLFSLWFPAWFILATFVVAVVRQRSELLCLYIPVLFLFITYLLGPLTNFRYLYCFELMLPVMGCVALGREEFAG